MADPARRTRVLVTGAAGRLGRLAARHLAEHGFDVVATDAVQGPGIEAADLTAPVQRWGHLLIGADAVLHCAGHRGPDTDWQEAQALNMDLSLALLMEARRKGVGRFVFLSSNWVMAGYRFAEGPIASSLPPRPINPYGCGKLAIERTGLAMANAGDFVFLALRIGMVIAGSEDIPARLSAMRRWSQEMWLSERDFCKGIDRALTASLQGGRVLNLMSANAGARWDLEETGRAIGYVPLDSWQPSVPSHLEAAEATFARIECGRNAAVDALTADSRYPVDAALVRQLDCLSGQRIPDAGN